MTSMQQPTGTYLQPQFDLPSFIEPRPTNAVQRPNIGTNVYKLFMISDEPVERSTFYYGLIGTDEVKFCMIFFTINHVPPPLWKFVLCIYM